MLTAEWSTYFTTSILAAMLGVFSAFLASFTPAVLMRACDLAEAAPEACPWRASEARNFFGADGEAADEDAVSIGGGGRREERRAAALTRGEPPVPRGEGDEERRTRIPSPAGSSSAARWSLVGAGWRSPASARERGWVRPSARERV